MKGTHRKACIMAKPILSRSGDPLESRHAKLHHLRQISDLWDRAIGIPGTKWRVGLESLLGLLPIGGDAVGLLLSSYILWHAIQFNLPKSLFLRMVFNVLLDAIAGSVPILGDIFDTTWKANTKNVNLLESYLQLPASQLQKADRRFLWLLFAGLGLIMIVLVAIAVVGVFLITQALKSS